MSKFRGILRLLACVAAGILTGGAIYYGMAGFGSPDQQAGLSATTMGTIMFLTAWFVGRILDDRERRG